MVVSPPALFPGVGLLLIVHPCRDEAFAEGAASFNGVPLRQAYARLSYGAGDLRLDTLRAEVGEGWLAGRGWVDRSRPDSPGHLELTLDQADAATLEHLLTGNPGASEGVVTGTLAVAG